MLPSRIVVFGGAAVDFRFRVPKFPIQGDQLEARVTMQAGGKGFYQAIACKRLGANTTFIGSVGLDTFGSMLKTILDKEVVDSHLNERMNPTATAIDTAISTDLVGIITTSSKSENGNHKTTYIACRDRDRLSMDYLEHHATQEIQKPDCDAVLVTFDTSIAALELVADITKKAGKALIINASPPTDVPLAIIHNAEYVVATAGEARDWLSLSGQVGEVKLKAMDATALGDYLQTQGANNVVITQDDEGCIVIDDTPSAKQFPAYEAKRPIGTNGARSAFCAALTVSLAEQRHSGEITVQKMVSFAAASRYFAVLAAINYDGLVRRAVIDEFLDQNPGLTFTTHARPSGVVRRNE